MESNRSIPCNSFAFQMIKGFSYVLPQFQIFSSEKEFQNSRRGFEGIFIKKFEDFHFYDTLIENLIWKVVYLTKSLFKFELAAEYLA